MLLIKIKFNMFTVDHFSSYYINFGVSRRHKFFTELHKISCIMGWRLKIFEGVSVLLNYLNLYKIKYWYISFIMYGHIRNYVLSTNGFSTETIKSFYIFFFYVLKYSLSQTCINANVRNVEWRHFRFFLML